MSRADFLASGSAVEVIHLDALVDPSGGEEGGRNSERTAAFAADILCTASSP
ncbi:MAG: hypothetical protein ACP5QO_02450 [Clostridia bacterium]